MEASKDPDSNPSGIETIRSCRQPKLFIQDFIINKYREEPSRRLTFTEVRKSLVGDVSLLHKIFLFPENWRLINCSAPSSDGGDNLAAKDEERCKVRIEEGAPNGVRVVSTPNFLKLISVPRTPSGTGDTVSSSAARKLPPLASFSDIYGDFVRQKELTYGVCGDKCVSGHYRSTQDNLVICAKCFKHGNYGDIGEKRSMDDFKLLKSNEHSVKNGALWTGRNSTSFRICSAAWR